MSSYGPPPAIPPHPTELYPNHGRQHGQNKPPPVPPLPPNFNVPGSHLMSPMPERILPNMSGDITQTLDNAAGYMSPPPPQPGQFPPRATSLYPNPPGPYDPYGHRSPAPPAQPGYPGGGPPAQPGYPGGFARPQSAFAPGPPNRYGPSPAPPPPPGSVVYQSPPPPLPPQHQHPQQHHPYPSPTPMPMPAYAGYSSPPPPAHHVQGYGTPLPQAMDNLSLHGRPPTANSRPPPSTPPSNHQILSDPQASSYSYSIPPGVTPPPSSGPGGAGADATAPIPTKDLLLAAQRILPPSPGVVTHLPWIRDVVFFIERTWGKNNEVSGPPVLISGDEVVRDIALRAAKCLQSFLPAQPQPHAPPPPEALYLRACFYALGCAPEIYTKSAREAFKDWEASARAGWPKAWWRVGREYETTGDVVRAKECFERGMKSGVESCFYRLGMAKLLGQLGFSPAPTDAMSLLHKAATLSSVENPHPAYMYGLLLLGEFSQVKVQPRDFIALIPQGSSPTTEARKYIERAAYLHFAPAQYKLGHAYEYALTPFPYDPLLSVQYYSLASQNGEPEADMALSKWFLCGAEGGFEKDEALAVVFAEKAARKALPSAEFAMGYYCEVGVGTDKNVQRAITWYEKAVAHGNGDASARLEALKKDANQVISRTEHDKLTDAKLVRRRTQAKMSAVADGRLDAAGPPLTEAQKIKAQALAAQASTAPIPSHQHQHQHSLPPLPQQQQQQPPPQQRPPQQHHQYNPNAPRYSLSDRPSPSSSPAPGPGAHLPSHPSQGRPAGKPPGRRHDNVHQAGQGSPAPGPGPAPGPTPQAQNKPPGGPQNATPMAHPPQPGPPKPAGHGPATFAEMGFQVGKAEDKDCKVM